MAKPDGTGNYLLLIDYGTEGWSVKRFETEQEILDAIIAGETSGNPFITAEDRPLWLGYPKPEEEEQLNEG